MTTITNTLAGLGALMFIAGCGGGAAEAPATTPEPAEPVAWDDMDMDQRRSFMGHEVTPRMAELFEGHDAERYAGFSCEGCHGETGADRNYAMPNPDLYTLYATGSQEQLDMVNNQRPMVNFMFQEVVPAMKELLDAPDYDAETQEGFSCYYCHPNGGEGTPAAPAEEANSLWMPRATL